VIINQIINSEKIFLKTLNPKNVTSKYIEWLNDFEVNKFLETRHSHQDINTVKEFVAKKNYSKDELLLGIFTRLGNNHIGNIKLGPIKTEHLLAEISIFIGDKNSWGKGYASESINSLKEFAFNALGLRKLTASMYETNKGSIAAFKKADFEIEALIPDHYLLNNKEENIVIMGAKLKN